MYFIWDGAYMFLPIVMPLYLNFSANITMVVGYTMVEASSRLYADVGVVDLISDSYSITHLYSNAYLFTLTLTPQTTKAVVGFWRICIVQ